MAENPEATVGEVANDDEFGEFEGFEGTPLEPVQAQPAPSPWATFPDLLPVQNSSATSVDDTSSPPVCSSEPLDEPWLVAATSSQHYPTSTNAAVSNVSIQQSRTPYPPDISLANYQVPSNDLAGACDIAQSSRLSNPPDISLADFSQGESDLSNGRENLVLSSRLSNPPDVSLGAMSGPIISESPDEKLGGLIHMLFNNAPQSSAPEASKLHRSFQQVPSDANSLRTQVQNLQQERTLQQEQIEALQQMNWLLEQQLSESNKQTRDTRTQLEEARIMQRRLTSDHNSMEILLQRVDHMQELLLKQQEAFHGQLQEEFQKLEQRLQGQQCENMNSFCVFVEKCIKTCFEEISRNIMSLIKDAVGNHFMNNQNLPIPELLEKFKKDLFTNSVEQRKLLKQEHSRHLLLLSSTLQSIAMQLKTENETDQSEGTES